MTELQAAPRSAGWGAHHAAFLALEARMGSRELRVWNSLVVRAGPDGTSWPSVERIAADTGMYRRGVQYALGGLERMGAIQREMRCGTTTRYRIATPEQAHQLVSTTTLEAARSVVRAVARGAPCIPLPVELPPLPPRHAAQEPRRAPAPRPAPIVPRPPRPAGSAATPIGFVMRDTLEAARATLRAHAPIPRPEPPRAPEEPSRRPPPPPAPAAPPVTGPMATKLEALRQGRGLDVGPEPQRPPAQPARAAPAASLPPGRRPETDEEVAAALEHLGKPPDVVKGAVEALQQARARPGGVTAPWAFAQAAVRRVEANLAAEEQRRERIRAEERATLEASMALQRQPCAAHGKPPPCGQCAAEGLAEARKALGDAPVPTAPRAPPAHAVERQPPCGVCGYRAISPGPCLACERNLRLVS